MRGQGLERAVQKEAAYLRCDPLLLALDAASVLAASLIVPLAGNGKRTHPFSISALNPFHPLSVQ